MNEHQIHKESVVSETADHVQQNCRLFPGQMREERLETARLHDGPVYTLHEIRRRVARTLRWRVGFRTGRHSGTDRDLRRADSS
jgi:hypothetical protein